MKYNQIHWLPIKGYEKTHLVSNYGHVIGWAWGKGYLQNPIELGQYDNGHGYPEVRLGRDGKTKRKTVHRLIAEAFIPNPENKPIVNHIDGNRWNNHVWNLEWVTMQENHDHAQYVLGTKNYKGAKNPNSKLTPTDVRNIRHLYSLGNIKQSELGEFFNVPQAQISCIVLKKRWKHIT